MIKKCIKRPRCVDTMVSVGVQWGALTMGVSQPTGGTGVYPLLPINQHRCKTRYVPYVSLLNQPVTEPRNRGLRKAKGLLSVLGGGSDFTPRSVCFCSWRAPGRGMNEGGCGEPGENGAETGTEREHGAR